MIGVLVLDRAGEYIEDTVDQRGNDVFGLQHHPHAPERMVIVSQREKFREMYQKGEIANYMQPIFNIKDIALTDLLDFYPNLTKEQRNLLRDCSPIENIYEKLLKETPLGNIDKGDWYREFPWLFEVQKKGKSLLKQFEESAELEGRDSYKEDELEKLDEYLGGTQPGVLERAIRRIMGFCRNPFLGGKSRGRDILDVQSCVNSVLKHLEQGHLVFIDLRGVNDEDYTLISALFT